MSNKISFAAIALVLTAIDASADAQEAGKKVIATPTAPNAIGPYSQAIQAGKTLYLAGQIAIDPKTNQLLSNGSIEEQTRRVLDNLTALLAADGLTMDHVCLYDSVPQRRERVRENKRGVRDLFQKCTARPSHRRSRPITAGREDRDIGDCSCAIAGCAVRQAALGVASKTRQTW